ncbi:MAG: hypothetical protein V7L21_08920 [Nostoc sp.]
MLQFTNYEWIRRKRSPNAYNGSQQIVSAIFPEVALTVEQVLAAGNVG